MGPRTPLYQSSSDFSAKWSMGTLNEIRTRQYCALCRLLIQAMPKTDSHLAANVDGGQDSDFQRLLLEGSQRECYLYWTADGMERVQQAQTDRVQHVECTRRLCIKWSHNPGDKAYIVLVAPNGKFTADGKINNGKWEPPTLFLGRLLTSLQQNSVDLIRSWLNICSQYHQEECQRRKYLLKKRRLDPRFRDFALTVVDVVDMCITELPGDPSDDARYVALSYTWGEETRITGGHGAPPKAKWMEHQPCRTTTRNIGALKQEDGILECFRGKMSRVLQNAIGLTQQLGYRYLWVDSLCIIQDDPLSWDIHANAMDIVYGEAELTICAADGDGPQAGLQALFPPEGSRYARHAEEYVADYELEGHERLQFILSRPSESYIAQSRWGRRAWTLQERLLSRRCLIFVGGRMYFQCQSTSMSEDIYSEAHIAGMSVELQEAPASILKRLDSDPLSVYKQCVELYTDRTLSHESSILEAFLGIATLINSSLGDGCELLFGLPRAHFDSALLWEPEGKPGIREGTTQRFPTWSWCGWKGTRITYRADTVAGLEIDRDEWVSKHTWITYYTRDGEGALRPVWDSSAGTSPEKTADDKFRGASWASDDQRYLHFSTRSCNFSLHEPTESDGSSARSTVGTGLRRFAILNAEGCFVGTCVLDASWSKAAKSGTMQQFIALSDAHDFATSERDFGALYGWVERNPVAWNLFNVMMIWYEEGNPDVAYRGGIGKVHKSAFGSTDNDWKEIILG